MEGGSKQSRGTGGENRERHSLKHKLLTFAISSCCPLTLALNCTILLLTRFDNFKGLCRFNLLLLFRC